MPGVRVGSLDLKLVAPAAMQGGAAALKRGAENTLIPAVLRAMERRLTRTHGERAVIRVRSIDIRLKLSPSDLASPHRAEAVGEDIAEQLLGQATIETASARSRQGAAAVRIWKDARQLTAARLSSAALRQVGPDDAKEAFDDLWQALTRDSPAEVALVLAELAGVDELAAVLDRLPIKALTALAKAVKPIAPAAVNRAIDRAAARRRRGEEPASRPKADPQTPAPPATAMAEPDPGPQTAQAPPRPESGAAAEDGISRRAALREASEQDGDAAQDASDDSKAEPHQQAAPPKIAAEQLAAAPSMDRTVPLSPEGPDTPGGVDVPHDLTDPELEPWLPPQFSSEWCALAYLLPIAIQAELPETLWQAGLDEGTVFCRAFALIAGGDDDPFTRILSRRFPDLPPAVGRVADWAREEVTTAALDRAVALGQDRAALMERIALFHACLSAGDGDDLAAWLAGYLLAMFENDTGHIVEPGAFDRCFAQPGRIEIEDDLIRVVQPIEAIDIDIRRAGLDGDPGWLAWIDKRMVLVFESDDEA